MSIQQGISGELSAEKAGRQMKVIIDRLEGEYYIGRTEFDSPEVDPEVLIERGDRALHIGNFYLKSQINKCDEKLNFIRNIYYPLFFSEIILIL